MSDITWSVLLEFRHNVASFEVTVDAPDKNAAIRIAEEAAVAAGWGDAELLRVTCFPQLRWVA